MSHNVPHLAGNPDQLKGTGNRGTLKPKKYSAPAESPKIVVKKSVVFVEILASTLKIIVASNVREMCEVFLL